MSVVCVATLASTFLFFIYALPTAALLALPYDRTLVLTTLHTPPAHDEVPFTFLSSLLAYLPTLVTTATTRCLVRSHSAVPKPAHNRCRRQGGAAARLRGGRSMLLGVPRQSAAQRLRCVRSSCSSDG